MLGAAAAARGAGRAPSQHHRQPQQPGRVPLKRRRDDSQRMVIRVEAQPDLTLEETVAVMRKRKIPGSRTALFRFLARHAVT